MRTRGQRGKRKRTVFLSADERAQRRREQHRAIDATRRQKETDAISTLRKLIGQQLLGSESKVAAVVRGDELALGGDSERAEEELEGRQVVRLGVLESSIALIEQLTAACQRMEEAYNAKDAQVKRMSGQLYGVAAAIAEQAAVWAADDQVAKYSQQDPASHDLSAPSPSSLPASDRSSVSLLAQSVSSFLIHSDISHTFRQSPASLLSDIAMTVIALPSKLVLDVNEMFLVKTGYRRNELLHQPMGEGPLVKGVSQYPKSVVAVDTVATGSERQGGAMWRCRRADGVLYECRAWFFGRYDDEWEMDSNGAGKGVPPTKMLIMCAMNEIVLLGDPRTADVAE